MPLDTTASLTNPYIAGTIKHSLGASEHPAAPIQALISGNISLPPETEIWPTT
ncbi:MULTISPECIES: hypothetical protein [Methylobacterium]|uniref:hypothetical protein n=1 Tax=Methylobacterium TaxID=407 RepID=UPI001404F0FC|nr:MULTISPECIES: hypothetical protein [Methylobacterium]MDR7036520.1 hypothetical protein [Methylobacterium sp. BE186]